ncbi:MAG: sulfite exporter TauE/SafE family protein [Acidimicrobiia bacterium]
MKWIFVFDEWFVSVSHHIVNFVSTTVPFAGLLIGALYGLFGVGSAFATPVLALLGVPGMAAVVGPLPAMLPGSAIGAASYARHGGIDWWVAKRTIAAGLPAAALGAAMSSRFGGPLLVQMSAVVLAIVGWRVLRPVPLGDHDGWGHERPLLLAGSAAAVGFLAGLLANGGGFLLVPLFLLAIGLDIHLATGTSLMVATALTVPTITIHAAAGDVDWKIAGLFAAGMIPGTRVGSVLSRRFSGARLRRAFGALLIAFAVWFMFRQIAAALA